MRKFINCFLRISISILTQKHILLGDNERKGVIILVAVILDVYSERIYDRMRNKE